MPQLTYQMTKISRGSSDRGWNEEYKLKLRWALCEPFQWGRRNLPFKGIDSTWLDSTQLLIKSLKGVNSRKKAFGIRGRRYTHISIMWCLPFVGVCLETCLFVCFRWLAGQFDVSMVRVNFWLLLFLASFASWRTSCCCASLSLIVCILKAGHSVELPQKEINFFHMPLLLLCRCLFFGSARIHASCWYPSRNFCFIQFSACACDVAWCWRENDDWNILKIEDQ